MCFLEFFEALIGCAMKSFENSQTFSKSKLNSTNKSVEPLNNITMKSVTSLQTNNQSPNKPNQEDSKKNTNELSNSVEKQELEQTVTIIDGATESERNVDDIRNWVERNNLFFSRFFPAASNYEIITQKANKAL